jgi:hypothetical protein
MGNTTNFPHASEEANSSWSGSASEMKVSRGKILHIKELTAGGLALAATS